MFDYKDRAMFEPQPANDDAPEAHSLLEAIATANRRVDAWIAWLSAISLIATVLFAVFLVSML